MKFSEDTYQQIHEYLTGEMNADEAKLFESQLKKDHELSEEVRIHRAMMDTLGDTWPSSESTDTERQKKIRDFLQSEEAELYKEAISKYGPQTSNQKKTWWYYVAAGLALLIASIAIFYVLDGSGISYQEYYAWNEIPSVTTRSSEKENLAQAENLFRKGAYDEALTIFRESLYTDRADATIFIYAGVCQLELGNYQESLKIFDQLLASDLLDRKKAHWYKALVHLSMEDKEKAIPELKLLLSEKDPFFEEQARKLLRQLD